MKILLFDIEVFPHNWMIGIEDYQTGELVQIWDDYDAVIKYINNNEKSIWVGFNNWRYDDTMIDAIFNKEDMYETSYSIIHNMIKPYKSKRLFTLDLYRDLKSPQGLEVLESEMGMSIESSSVDFDIDRPLTEEEIKETNHYNAHDIKATRRLFDILWRTTYQNKLNLIKYYNLDIELLQSTTATIVANGLEASQPRKPHPIKHFKFYDTLRIDDDEIKEFYVNEEYLRGSRDFIINGIQHRVGLGGIHGARRNYKSKSGILMDVVGYYSLIMMLYNLLSRNIKNPESYRDLYETRRHYKETGNPLQSALKGGVLAVFGATQNKWQLLYDPSVGDLIMVTGQVFLIDLNERIQEHAKLVQSNTDGLFVEPHNYEAMMKAAKEWEERTGFVLEYERYENLWQKDVNNYVCLLEGKVEAKGGYVNLWNADKPEFENNLGRWIKQGAVVHKALVNYMLYDIPFEDTINDETNMMMFQFTSRTTKGHNRCVIHKFNPENPEDESYEEVQRVNRLFARKQEDDYIYTMKQIRSDDDTSINLIPKMPENIFVYNGDMEDFDLEHMIDRQWYIDLAYKRLDDYLGIKPEKKPRKFIVEVCSEEDKELLLKGNEVFGVEVIKANGMITFKHRFKEYNIIEGTDLKDVLDIRIKPRKRGIEYIRLSDSIYIKLLITKNFTEIGIYEDDVVTLTKTFENAEDAFEMIEDLL